LEENKPGLVYSLHLLEGYGTKDRMFEVWFSMAEGRFFFTQYSIKTHSWIDSVPYQKFTWSLLRGREVADG
jgi:hypothetical protein